MKIDKILEKPVFLDELKTEIQKLIVKYWFTFYYLCIILFYPNYNIF
jgi:hypothetical protein